MGCDCTAHFEVKIDNKWEHYSVPNIHRNYLLFEKMAGVRGSVENALAPPKGLPDDISNITRIDSEQWGIDGHHHSWLSGEEFNKLHQYHLRLQFLFFYFFVKTSLFVLVDYKYSLQKILNLFQIVKI